MRFLETGLQGAWVIEPEATRDERGFFARVFCEREFAAHGLETRFVQHSISQSREAGTLRGLHFQRPPHQEAKLVGCVRGAIHDVIVDLRPGSATRGAWQAFLLTHENRRQLYVPKGFAHGFQTLEGDSEVHYLISTFHEPAAGAGWRHDDPAFAIQWPRPVSVISEKDRAWPDYRP